MQLQHMRKSLAVYYVVPFALYIHPVEFVTVSPALSPAPAFFVCLISFSFVSIFYFLSPLTFPCKSKSVTLQRRDISPLDVR